MKESLIRYENFSNPHLILLGVAFNFLLDLGNFVLGLGRIRNLSRATIC
jgi:hypothetical protein